MLVVNHVTKKYGNFTALEDITLEFTKGVYAVGPQRGGNHLIKMLPPCFSRLKEILWEGMEINKLGKISRGYRLSAPEFGYNINLLPVFALSGGFKGN